MRYRVGPRPGVGRRARRFVGTVAAPRPTYPPTITGPSLDELLDLRAPQRSEGFRFDVLDRDLQVIGRIYPDLDSVPRVANQTSRTMMRTVEGFRVSADQFADVDTFADRIKPYYLLEGTAYALGVFLWADASRLRRSYGVDLEGTLVDQSVILDQTAVNTVHYPEGSMVRDAIVDVVTNLGFSSAGVGASPWTVGHPCTWPGGQRTWLAILRDLSFLGGYLPCYFDRDGLFRDDPSRDPASREPVSLYRADASGRIVAGSIVESDDLLDAPNRYVVISTGGGTAGSVTGTYDIPGSAPHSIPRRGFIIPRVIEAQGVGNVDQATVLARLAWEQDVNAFAWADFSGPLDPRHDTWDTVDYLGDLWREVEWEMELVAGGLMRHGLRRVYEED